MARSARELSPPLVVRAWLQEFWEEKDRVPYRHEAPADWANTWLRYGVPAGWRAELELMSCLKKLGLKPDWSPGADAAGVDLKFTLDGIRVLVQLKVRQEEKAVRFGISRRSSRVAYLLLVLPATAVGRLDTITPQLVDSIRRRLLAQGG